MEVYRSSSQISQLSHRRFTEKSDQILISQSDNEDEKTRETDDSYTLHALNHETKDDFVKIYPKKPV